MARMNGTEYKKDEKINRIHINSNNINNIQEWTIEK